MEIMAPEGKVRNTYEDRNVSNALLKKPLHHCALFKQEESNNRTLSCKLKEVQAGRRADVTRMQSEIDRMTDRLYEET